MKSYTQKTGSRFSVRLLNEGPEVIGTVTAAISAAGCICGRMFGNRFGNRSTVLGGLVLLGIAVKIMFFG